MPLNALVLLVFATLLLPKSKSLLPLQLSKNKCNTMALKKEIRSDNTYILSADSTENPKLGAKILQNGKESLFLDFYFGYKKEAQKAGKIGVKIDRKREYLKLYLWQAPRTPAERQQNKDTLELAKKVRFERGQELLQDMVGYRLRQNGDINFIDYYQNYIDHYAKVDIRMIRLSFKRFKDFLRDTPEYSAYQYKLSPKQINRDMIEAFTEYLKSKGRGEGPKTIYQRFKKVINYAIDHDIFTKNPCKGISIKVDDNVLRKAILSPEEIERLVSTHYEGENPNIRRAFIFCLYTGIRFCDVKDLTFANVDYSNRLLTFEQNKTRGHSAASGVVIPLNEGHLQLIGKPADGQGVESLIFPLPSYEMCLKALKHWTKRAGIDKNISWHCARHSFAVNVLNNGANIKTVASLLGHSGLKYTEKYTRAIDSLKEAAVNSLPKLDLSQI